MKTMIYKLFSIIVILILVFFLTIPAYAWRKHGPIVIGDEDIVMAGTTVVYTLTPATGTSQALITVEGDTIRWKGWTTDPTDVNGAILKESDYLWLDNRTQIDNFGAIIKSGGNGTTIYVIYYGPED